MSELRVDPVQDAALRELSAEFIQTVFERYPNTLAVAITMMRIETPEFPCYAAVIQPPKQDPDILLELLGDALATVRAKRAYAVVAMHPVVQH